jgi:hypothetical protein
MKTGAQTALAYWQQMVLCPVSCTDGVEVPEAQVVFAVALN